MSGFTGAGYPKAVPPLGARIRRRAARRSLQVGVWTGASTAPELDGALAEADGIDLRMPYQSDPVTRDKIKPGGWTISTCTCRTWRKWSGKASSGIWTSPSSRLPASPRTAT